MDATESATWYFDSAAAAAEALIVILTDARKSKKTYSFGGLSVTQLLNAGLNVTGELAEVRPKLDAVPGALRY